MAGTRRSGRSNANATAEAAEPVKKAAAAKTTTTASANATKKRSSSAGAGKEKRRDGGGKPAAANVKPVTEENRLKRETAFLCHMQFKNDLPPVPVDWKMLQTRVDRSALTEYSHLSLYDGLRRRGDFSEDLGIPLDPSLMRAYRVPEQRATMDPEDHEILMDSSERESRRAAKAGGGARAANRPDASDALWLMNTQYISGGTIKARTGLSEKEMKRRKLAAAGGLDSASEVELSQVEQIEASFEAAKKAPVHPTKPGLKVAKVLPVLPDFERMPMDYVRMLFDEKQHLDVPSLAGKSAEVVENALNCGVVKPFSIVNEDDQTERFLTLMLPQDPEAAMSKDYLKLDGEEKPYDYVRDYVYKIQRDDPNLGGGNMCFFFKDDCVTYVDLHTKLSLVKKSKHSKGKEMVDWKPSAVYLKRRRLNEEESAAFAAKRASVRG
jgi:RNA polymerase II-associated factor 1